MNSLSNRFYILAFIILSFLSMSASCDPIIDQNIFNNIDSHIAAEVDKHADRCFAIVERRDLEGRDGYELWEQCMIGFFDLQSLLSLIKDDIKSNNFVYLRQHGLALIDKMILLGLEVPKEFYDFIEGIEQ